MGGKQKGAVAEREIVSMLWGSNFAAIRAAGSGVQRFYSPDVLASNGSKVLAIECKSERGTATPEQREWLALLAGAGVETMLARPRDAARLIALLA